MPNVQKRWSYTRAMRALAGFVLVSSLLMVVPVGGESETQAPAEIAADLGPCSALITVTDAESKPVYGAKISTRVQYGFMAVKKLDLEAFTGQDGKVKISKLPSSLKKPMVIHIDKGEKSEQVEFKPNLRCRATFDVQLR